jgi:hypothetical protein
MYFDASPSKIKPSLSTSWIILFSALSSDLLRPVSDSWSEAWSGSDCCDFAAFGGIVEEANEDPQPVIIYTAE